MTLSELRTQFFESLKDVYPSEETQAFFYELTGHYLQLRRIDVALKPKQEISTEVSNLFSEAISKLKRHQPIQYITGITEFFGLPFGVNEHTLIPRPETEELVEWILKDLQQQPLQHGILDIGTGSGCIAISLAKHLPKVPITALDISQEALQIATKNAVRNTVEIDFLKHDILSKTPLPKTYDIIVSNPPYVRELEKKAMHHNVLDYEPGTALFVSDSDPLLFYRKIAQVAKSHLSPKGILYFEINEYLGKEMKTLLETEGFSEIQLKKDLFGKDRMLKCRWYE
ncbi:peptide chain release factor N(5)-glutamine methyltransferase [Cochleicola gelatinilyticus]|uniref:Release factor glutamine methyltransferase n=1 Tax=Cochleicola gelatinilyticus TaxID=1763537 RepID=A0A167HE60_9FLAO|nr:peptide chain release factor N(5)-glutamine methyltransferase [Cochleicola gelatinilyticus]OAB78518.1 protein-(glutamine-N5) methyltransferase, release factor-specific [Cochleicola gelatinilyticus]